MIVAYRNKLGKESIITAKSLGISPSGMIITLNNGKEKILPLEKLIGVK